MRYLKIMGGIGHEIKKVVSAPFKVVGSLLGGGGGGAQTVTVQAPEVSGVDIQASTAAQTPDSPALGTSATSATSKKKRGKAGLMIQRSNSNGTNSGGSGGYSGLNI